MLSIYKASAGSGKTFQLAKEYIKLLLGVKDKSTSRTPVYHLNRGANRISNQHRGILAITFTNKATEEMKTRIVNELVKISKCDPDSKYIAELSNDVFHCSANELAAVADKALRELLLDYDNFNVSTIDSFFQQVMRSLAYELDYPGNYEIVIDSESVTSEAVDMVLDSMNYNADSIEAKNLREQLKAMMRDKCNEGTEFNVFNRNLKLHNAVVKDMGALFNEKYQKVAREFEEWFTLPTSDLTEYRNTLRAHLNDIEAANKKAAKDVHGFLDKKNLLDSLKKNLKGFFENLGDVDYILSCIKGDKVTTSAKEAIEGNFNYFFLKGTTIDDDTQTTLEKTVTASIERCRLYATLKALHEQIDTYNFMHYTSKFIKQIRDDNNIVLLADTNDLLSRVMGDKHEISFVYEKMGVRLHNFLIDEFQDTSQLQWDNLRQLVFEGLSNDNDSLIIGDEKQAIYRFRNSDSSMLHHSVADETINEFRDEKTVNTMHSDTNWRSAPDIIRFNNTFFGRMAKRLNIDGYENVVQQISSNEKDTPGYVRLINLTAPAEKEEKGKSKEAKSETDADLKADENAKQDVLQLMLDQINDEIGRGYAPGDIAVLVNTHPEARNVASFLLKNSIDVTTDEALVLNRSQSVRLIVSIMQLVADAKVAESDSLNADTVNDADVHKKYASANDKVGKFEYEYIKALTEHKMTEAKAIKHAMQRSFGEDSDCSTNTEISEIAKFKPSTLHTLVEFIVENRIPEDKRRKEIAYIAAFQDVVMNYALIFGNDICAFLRWWGNNSKKFTITSPSEINAVKIMTIHKSKGLQFKCVHIPNGSYNLLGNSRKCESIWMTKDNIPHKETLPADVLDKMPNAIRLTLDKFTNIDGGRFKSLWDENNHARMVDGFNKMYVAYTRAERELLVYYDGNKDFGKHIVNIANFEDVNDDCLDKDDNHNGEGGTRKPVFHSELHLNIADFADANKPQGNFTIGTGTHPKEKKEKTLTADEIAKQEDLEKWFKGFPTPADLMANYPTKIDKKYEKITTVNATMTNKDEAVTDDDESSKQRLAREHMDIAAKRGERLHYALSRIYRLNSNKDIEHALRPTFKYDFTDEDAKDIHKFFNTPESKVYVDRWFRNHDRSANEMTIFHPDAPETEPNTRRPDRIVWNADGTIDVIDYKFTGDTDGEHNSQVGIYVNLLHLIYPGRTISGYIWYADHTPAHIDLAATTAR